MRMYLESGTMTNSFFFVRNRRSFTSSYSHVSFPFSGFSTSIISTSESKLDTSPPAALTKLQIIVENSSTSLCERDMFSSPSFESRESVLSVKEDLTVPLLCSTLPVDLSSTIVATTPGFFDRRFRFSARAAEVSAGFCEWTED